MIIDHFWVQTDASLLAKAVYFLACLLNSICIVVAEASYFFLAVATTTGAIALDAHKKGCAAEINPGWGLFAILLFVFSTFPWMFVSRLLRWPLEKLVLRTRYWNSCREQDKINNISNLQKFLHQRHQRRIPRVWLGLRCHLSLSFPSLNPGGAGG